MRLFLRLLLWLSISVLSLQGGAAKACGHLEQAAHATPVASGHQHHQAAGQLASGHCDKAGARAGAAPHSKCAHCASCCVGAIALPATPPGVHAPALVDSLHAMPDAAMTSVVPSTLERPPRRPFV